MLYTFTCKNCDFEDLYTYDLQTVKESGIPKSLNCPECKQDTMKHNIGADMGSTRTRIPDHMKAETMDVERNYSKSTHGKTFY